MAAPPGRDVTARRVRVRAEGLVQGVGFRPFVFRIAGEHALSGHVLNDAQGVLAEVEGDGRDVDAFLAALVERAPPLARVERIAWSEVAATGERGFAIRPSPGGGTPDTAVSADAATCDACVAELWDPADRRHRYPFINCTDCGPRFTIVQGVPYDRPATTMAGFAMCPACLREYEDPRDRRFHAQPNACPVCGPQAWLAAPTGARLVTGRRDEAIVAAAAALRAGAIVAVKGLGGFHLACLASDEDAVAALRARKHREVKPLAVMVGGLGAAEELCRLQDAHRALLSSVARPIVLAPARRGARVAPGVAPASRELGLMLPYTPLHHLLLRAVGAPVVLTSGNRSDEPIAFRDEDALERLAGIADRFLLHDRPIHTRAEDSVARVAGGRPLLLRRARGYAPQPLALPAPCPRHVLAVGAQLKSTFCVARGDRAWLGPHLGDLDDWDTLRAFREGERHLAELCGVEPAVVAHDLHPDYLSTAEALAYEGVDLVGVQHHHAHFAACLAEHGVTRPAVGAIYDGVGLGTDGTAWGGELFAGDLASVERVGHLRPVALPGGDRAARQPWRMACAWLAEARGGEVPDVPLGLDVDPARWRAVGRLASSCGTTTSAGRLFDAIAALCGFSGAVRYEGQAAIELEARADRAERGTYPIAVVDGVLDPREAVLAAARDVAAGVGAGVVSARFHAGLAHATAAALIALAGRRAVDVAVLSGGVFANALLLDATARELAAAGLRVLVPERVPPGDGGVSYGQAAVVAARGAA